MSVGINIVIGEDNWFSVNKTFVSGLNKFSLIVGEIIVMLSRNTPSENKSLGNWTDPTQIPVKKDLSKCVMKQVGA